jgi:hypothetical protein
MAHYAFLDENNIVIQVIVGKDETELLDEQTVDWENFYSQETGLTCKRTSFNTHRNEHLAGGVAFRGNYAGIGYSYNLERDIFIAPKPFESWVLNEDTLSWEAPVEFPFESNIPHDWDEENQQWIPTEIPNEELWA